VFEMSKISIYINENAPTTETVRVLRPITGESISYLQRAIATEQPVYRCELFLNDFADVADTLRSIVMDLDSTGVHFTITEEIKGAEETITKEILLKILSDSESYRL